MKFCVIGFGGRGNVYSRQFTEMGLDLVGVCDNNEKKLLQAKSRYNLSDEKLFNDDDNFFKLGKIADLCVISTPDNCHIKHAIIALEKGYDLLLEKPISTNIEDCNVIYELAKKLNRKVFVCHVLRYAPFFLTIKNELTTGKYGNVATINLEENVSYWHQAHSFVRGNWRNKALSSPMILQKCSHDLDLISWFADKKIKYISSMGSLNHYKASNAPKGSGTRCLECGARETCPYDAEKIYIKERFDKGIDYWPVDVLTTNVTREGLMEAIRTGPYGRCVYKCDNDVVDHQVVNMQFEDGVTAHLTMTAFTNTGYRRIHVYGEKGEIYGSMEDSILYCNIFGGESKVIDIKANDTSKYGHGGGDLLMAKDIINYLDGKSVNALTTIDKSMQSHIIAFAAEESRLKNGELIKID